MKSSVAYTLLALTLVDARAVFADPLSNLTIPIRAPGLWTNQISFNGVLNGHSYSKSSDDLDAKVVTCVDLSSELEKQAKMLSHSDCRTQTSGTSGSPEVKYICTSKNATITLTVDSFAPSEAGKEMTAFHQKDIVTSTSFSGEVDKHGAWIGKCPEGIHAGDTGVLQSGTFTLILSAQDAQKMGITSNSGQ